MEDGERRWLNPETENKFFLSLYLALSLSPSLPPSPPPPLSLSSPLAIFPLSHPPSLLSLAPLHPQLLVPGPRTTRNPKSLKTPHHPTHPRPPTPVPRALPLRPLFLPQYAHHFPHHFRLVPTTPPPPPTQPPHLLPAFSPPLPPPISFLSFLF